MNSETPVVFCCAADRLIGILHESKTRSETGVVIVVGGPQYRVGSHRQFVHMARTLAAAGTPVLRFDYRGMGDAEGEPRSFEEIGEDIRAAIDCLLARLPDVKRVVLLGLCDAATASVIYAPTDSRVSGLILLNPWVRTVQGEAQTQLRHYYLQRLLQKSFWRKVLRGKFAVSSSIREFSRSFRDAHFGGIEGRVQNAESGVPFLLRMRRSLEEFQGRVLFLISGRDLTAQEFVDLCRDDRQWAQAAHREGIAWERLAEANHTMSVEAHLAFAETVSIQWLTNDLPDPV